MFFFRKLFGLFFLGLLVFGLFGAFGRGSGGRYEAAYRQGFVDGRQAAAEESAAVGTAKTAVPGGTQGVNVYVRDHGFILPGSGFLLLCLVPWFAFGMMFMGAGRRRHGRGGPHPCGHGHGPWDHEGRSSSEKSPDDIDDGPPEPAKYA